MKSLVIVAHGSRRQASNEEVKVLAAKVEQHLPSGFSGVKVAFLELASPSIEATIDACYEEGASEVVVLPYFLSEGTHVAKDVPSEVGKAMDKWPDKKIDIVPHIGSLDSMIDLILSVCTTAD
ncbi:sirohydrochlorin chelatase [Alkalimarinus sediminis]|uniref:CbiX/SirB N-terminal domain-containing protein n=1 Tax=Alkalimarinus sediminis TaxID=1632866 RepID=A0A9E8HGK4_9ALTE|nr:CbiX/SirB N-terminal domain-containing protein [Alkalimarinus sediminis]UZW74280.1 CbiX/SirB N-terminal domain-containing protein [Alkalimarinus sediminis]